MSPQSDQPLVDMRSIAKLNLLSVALAAMFVFSGAITLSGIKTVIQYQDLFYAFGLSCFILFGPGITPYLSYIKDALLRESIGVLILLGIASVVGLLSEIGGIQPFALGATMLLSIAAVTRFLLSNWSSRPTWPSLVMLGCSTLLGLWVVSLAWGSLYQSPLFFEQLVIGNAHKDTLYHSSLSGMLRLYGTPSTGLDGTPIIAYHWGSHLLIAALTQLLHFSSLVFYNVGYQIILIPIFFKVFGLFALSVRRVRTISTHTSSVFFFTWTIAFISFIPGSILWNYATWADPLYISESYLIGLTWGFLFLSITVHMLSGCDHDRLTLLFLLIGLPVMLAALTLTKVSVGAVATACYGYWLVRSRKLYSPRFFLSGILTLLAFVLVYRATWGSGTAPLVEPFHFYNNYVKVSDNFKWIFFLVHFMWAWFFLASIVIARKLFEGRSVWKTIKSGNLLEAELLAVLAFIGFLPGAMINFESANSFYFSDIQRWIGISLILAYLPIFTGAIKKATTNILLQHPGLNHMKYPAYAAISFITIALSYAAVIKVTHRVHDYIEEVSSDKAQYAERIETQEGLFRQQVRDHLLDISKLPREERLASCLYIPKSNSLYWKYLERDGAAPLVAPSVSGIRSIYGLPTKETSAWGYDQYDFANALHTNATEEQLRMRALELGCRQVFEISFDEKIKMRKFTYPSS